jgi:hypothetical protein
MQRFRELVHDLSTLPEKLGPSEMDVARSALHGMLGPVTLKPKKGALWAYPSLNAKGLAETSPSHILMVARAGFGTLQVVFELAA